MHAGLALMQAIVAGDAPMPSMARTCPIRFTQAEHGVIMGAAQADERHLNPMGSVHGGFAATVLDSVTGCAVHSTLDEGDTYATVDLAVKMLRPLPTNIWLPVHAQIMHVSRSLGVAEGRLTDADGQLLAFAAVSCLIRRAGH